MPQIDLITGFLGAGKTTFIRKYVTYLLSQGEKVCILENDYGAVNVDMMLLSDLKGENLGIEMVAGGCDYDCHRRRFRTKLITMAMLGYSRVIIEPSGIFDVDEFFDILHEDPLDRRYEIGSVLTIVNADLEENFTPGTDYMLASQCSQAGRLILSHVQEVDEERIRRTIGHINRALASIRCDRSFSLEENVTALDWSCSTVPMLLVAGLVFTALTYTMYFTAIPGLRAQTAALGSYVDPVVAVLVSALFLHEPMTAAEWIGAALILGATAVSTLD